MNSIIDQYSDKGQYLLVKILGTTDTENITKLASTLEMPTKLASTKFACADFRKFPIDTQDNVILSKMYFDHQKDNIPAEYRVKIASKLDTYLDLYNIPDSIFATPKLEVTKQADESVEPRYLLPKVGLCKVASVQDLQKANNVFETEYKKLNINDRVEFSKNFMKCASDLKFKEAPKSMIVKYASLLDTDFSEVKNFLSIRVAAANRVGKSGKEYTKLAEVLDQGEISSSKEDLEKLAEVILDIDSRYGFDQPKYDKVMPCAYGVVFNKVALDAGGVSEEEEASDITKAKIVGKYGHGILEEVEKEDGSIDKEKLNNISKKLNLRRV